MQLKAFVHLYEFFFFYSTLAKREKRQITIHTEFHTLWYTPLPTEEKKVQSILEIQLLQQLLHIILLPALDNNVVREPVDGDPLRLEI